LQIISLQPSLYSSNFSTSTIAINGVQGGIGYIDLSEIAANTEKQRKLGNPLPNEKVCFNCKQMMWMVGLGLGLKCRLTSKNIENRRHTCDKFEFK